MNNCSVHRVQISAGSLSALALDGYNHIGIAPGECCLVCLCG